MRHWQDEVLKSELPLEAIEEKIASHNLLRIFESVLRDPFLAK